MQLQADLQSLYRVRQEFPCPRRFIVLKMVEQALSSRELAEAALVFVTILPCPAPHARELPSSYLGNYQPPSTGPQSAFFPPNKTLGSNVRITNVLDLMSHFPILVSIPYITFHKLIPKLKTVLGNGF